MSNYYVLNSGYSINDIMSLSPVYDPSPAINTYYYDVSGDIGRQYLYTKIISTDTYQVKHSSTNYYVNSIDLKDYFLPRFIEGSYIGTSTTITPPAWTTKIRIFLIGGGGGGGSGNLTSSGGAGGGGAFYNILINYQSGYTINYSPGQGGSGGTYNSSNPTAKGSGSNGGITAFTYRGMTWRANPGGGWVNGSGAGVGVCEGPSSLISGVLIEALPYSGSGSSSGWNIVHQGIQNWGTGGNGGNAIQNGSAGSGGYVRIYFLIN